MEVEELRRERTGYICKQYQASTTALRGAGICVYRISVYFGWAQGGIRDAGGRSRVLFWASHPAYQGLEQQDCNVGSLLSSDNGLGLLIIRRPTSELNKAE